MDKNLNNLFILLEKEVIQSYEKFKSLKIKDENDFVSNQNNIAFSVAIVNKLSKIICDVDKDTLNFVSELGDILIPLIKYEKNLISKYGTVNTYKLYDFMTLDLKKLKKILNSILKK